MTLRQAVDRYGAAVVIVVALSLLVLLTPGNKDNSDGTLDATNSGGFTAGTTPDGSGETTDFGTASTLPDGTSIGGSGSNPSARSGGNTPTPVSGSGYEFGKGANCRADGRQVSIERVAPPCSNWTTKDNGGSTSQGVAKDKILIVRYIEQVSPATRAILEQAQLADDPAVVKRAYEALFTYFNQHYETYGRQVVFQDYDAQGPPENQEQARADAIKISTEIKPFAVWGGGKAFASEIASRNIICICTVTLSSEYYRSLPPYIFGSLPTSTEYGQHLGEYIGKKLWNRPAKFVGPGFTPQQVAKRKFGLIYIEGIAGQADPEGKRAKDTLVAEMAKYGAKFGDGDTFAYTYEPGRNQQDFTNMMIKFKGDGVTSLVMYVDPLSPILITQAATNQAYFPEWIISGSGLSDTTAAGRLYDQQQWQHAFGISPLWVTWATVQKSYGWRETHHGNPNMADGDEGVLINIYASVPRLIFTGIHMAGPKLTPQSYAAGMFAYPKSGGTPSTPTAFFTREYPTAIKDFMEIYYDRSRRGEPDERGIRGDGMIMKMALGKRYVQGQWSTDETKAFNDPTAVSVSDDPALGGDPPHEQDGHKHTTKCLSCS